MSDKDRDHAAEQENSAASLANLDVGDAAVGGSPDITDGDLAGVPTEGEDETPHPDRLHRVTQE